MALIRIIIADDHKIFRQGLRLSLHANHRLKLVGEVEDGEALIELLAKQPADIVLLDLKMPKLDGFATTERLKVEFPDVKIIILTMYDDEQFIIRLMENGTNGYLIKNAEPKEITTAINSVFETGYYFSSLVSNALLKRVIQKDKPSDKKQPEVTLTDKEKEILKLICEENTTAEISNKVCLSPRTIDGIRGRLIEKVGVRNTTGLVIYAIRTGIFL